MRREIMASYNGCHASRQNASSVSFPSVNKNDSDEDEVSGQIIEDDILYQMDHELDQRLSQLCKMRTGQMPSTAARGSEEEKGSACLNEIELMPTGSSTNSRQDQLSEAIDESEENLEAKDELPKNVLDENEEDGAKEEGVFDEFLDHSTRLRIGMLTKKVNALTEALKFTQEECRRLSHAKREVSTAAQMAEKERHNMKKQVQTLQQELLKLQRSNKHCQQHVKELTGECQALRKELSSKRQRESERRSAQSSCEAQLTRSRADNAAFRDQLANLKVRHKEEVDQLRASIKSSSTRIKDLERQQRNFSALVKKQEKLITVLNEQKNNMAAAKAAAGLEEKFLAIISPLQPP